MGFCLRSASENVSSLSQIRRLLGVGENEQFKQSHAARLSRLTGASEAWLIYALPERAGKGAGRRYQCYGHAFRAPTALRARNPQVCPLCIHHHGYAMAVWDLGLSTTCLEHGNCLVDQCPTCHRMLRWDRPSLLWGHCTHAITANFIGTEAPGVTRSFQALIETSLKNESTYSLLEESLLPRWLDGLSPSGWTDLMMAFGTIEERFQVPADGTYTRLHRSESALSIVTRGFERLVTWSRTCASISTTTDLIAFAPLQGLLLEPAGDADLQIGQRLCEAIYGVDISQKLRTRNPALAQMSLF